MREIHKFTPASVGRLTLSPHKTSGNLQPKPNDLAGPNRQAGIDVPRRGRTFPVKETLMATPAKAVLPWKPQSAPDSDFYHPADTLNAEARAHVARVTILGVLAASIAHEINQSLSGIVTNAGTCLRMLSADPPNVDGAREIARRTIRDVNRASEVIARLRALFAKKKDATTESVNLNEAARDMIALSLNELHRNGVILHSELADDIPLVMGDRVQLQQVILNLLINALDAMRDVGDRPKRLVIRTERYEDDRVRLSVRDTGVGFEPQAADRLFEAFYTTKSGGMGIGLSVSRSIIESHRGRLWAAPNDGPGATFAFSIPCGPERVPRPPDFTVRRRPERAQKVVENS
jgi:signal transduction histidine kinase